MMSSHLKAEVIFGFALLEHLECECSLQPSPPGCFAKKLSEARGNGIGFVTAGEAAPPSLLAVQLVLGIRRSARAAQHAGPSPPPWGGAAWSGYLVGRCRSSVSSLRLLSLDESLLAIQ